MKFARIIFWLSVIIQFCLGLLMILRPNIMQRLIYAPEPGILIQTIGSIGIAIGLLALLTLQKPKNIELWQVSSTVLAVFNLGLGIFLGIAAKEGLISWLGVVVHLPIAIGFILVALQLQRNEIK